MTSSTDPPDDIPTDDGAPFRDLRYACPSIEEIDASMEEIAPSPKPEPDPGPTDPRVHDEIGPFPSPAFITGPELVILDIPPRRWVMGRTLLRGSITGLIGGGAVGKSSLILGMAVAVITGLPLVGDHVHEQGKCWVHNCEDDRIETRRRLAALLQHHGIPDDDVVAKIAISTGLEYRLTIAMKAGFGGRIDYPHVRNCIDYIKANDITFAAFDPFIGLTRSINENDNADVDAVCDGFRRIAHETNAAILIAQHTGKPPRGRAADPTDVNVARGAIAFVNGTRIAQQLTTLDREMAKDLNISEAEAYRYLRRDDGKTNHSLKNNEALAWYSRETVPLANGDDVGVIVTSTIGKKETGTVADIKARTNEKLILDEVERCWTTGWPLTLSPQAKTRYLPRVMKDRHAMLPGVAEKLALAMVSRGALLEGEMRGRMRGLRIPDKPQDVG